MHTAKQSGFGVIAIIVAILVVVGLGYVGYRVYTANNNQTGNSTQGSNTQNNSTQDTATYLDIKELGVKIKLSDGIKDAVYSASTSTDGSQFARISTQSLQSQSNNTCGTSFGPLGTITKASGTPEQVFGGTSRTVDNTTTFKFGNDTYVFIASPQAQCSTDSSVQALADQQRITFFTDFKTVQLDN